VSVFVDKRNLYSADHPVYLLLIDKNFVPERIFAYMTEILKLLSILRGVISYVKWNCMTQEALDEIKIIKEISKRPRFYKHRQHRCMHIHSFQPQVYVRVQESCPPPLLL